MRTKDQYFTELEGCLRDLPQVEREELMEYHREYADEAGLEDYDQMAGHFGTPRELSDRLYQELDARRAQAASSPEDSINDAVQQLLDSLFSRSGRGSGQKASDASDAQEQVLPAFHNVEIGTRSADIRFEEGEEFAVRYQLPGGEVPQRLEVTGDTLYFTTCVNGRHRSSGRVEIHLGGRSLSWSSGRCEVVVVLPKDAELHRVNLTTASGDIFLENRSCTELQIHSASGDVQLQQLTCPALSLLTVSGDVTMEELNSEDISVTTTSGDLDCRNVEGRKARFRTVSGDVDCGAVLDTLQLNTVSGDCIVSGPVAVSIGCTTVSGDVRAAAQNADVTASTISGDIRCNGMEVRRRLHLPGTGCRLEVKTTSGDIDILTQ